ncbi:MULTISPECIES: enoyl-CoA hydratase/isomerase family protein [unclassified Variovorax]|uniref:enoyl-CoA hydratase/isomerase family protein n=1 Tax=unclassified Variovorax TaxID=663243 RepID=UPI002574CB8F|nr:MULTISPECIES: enoyl-CoA hydratase/isomerase family protein [unclassified Variovorax]MDM0086650.1 enoyl-CoA hydratase/isomerase family protein [Variovorax sp. J22G40]MDM0145094.1 enoyl-CoA hydratase/isomerase family protein [Variovorax sp. J2P1-31]
MSLPTSETTHAYRCIRLDIDRWVATLTMALPDKMNALGDDLLLEMQHALDALEQNPEIRALVITGEGRAFSSGFDLSPREKPFTTVQDWREHARMGNDTFLRIWRSRLPVIAAVNGFCLGGGCELSMACDITLAADDAQFGEPEIQFQSAPPLMIMPWIVGMKKTKELMLTGDRIGAHEAREAGLATRVVPAATLLEEAQKLALRFSMIAPDAMQMNKQTLNRSYEMRGFQSTIDYGAEMFALIHLLDSEEKREFFGIAQERGLKAAFKWRDEKFAVA